ncbi:hypothetical protein NV379_13945 [Paenibacillus sp. N1-5-1-14]|nr:hypothetical protein [Paenibacillus radicibacter]
MNKGDGDWPRNSSCKFYLILLTIVGCEMGGHIVCHELIQFLNVILMFGSFTAINQNKKRDAIVFD